MSSRGVPRVITIVDHRQKKSKPVAETYKLNIENTESSMDLLSKLTEKLGTQNFVLTFPNRTPVDANNYHLIKNKTILWVLRDFDQRLRKTVGTKIQFQPHHHTITESGMYEYYDSRGIDSLVISLAELIDNSLAATKFNDGLRYIEIRYYDNGNDSMVVILDNGHGMDFKGLNDWAKFKLSKNNRKKIQDKLNANTSNQDLDTSFGESGYGSGFSSNDLPLRGGPLQPEYHIPDPKDRKPGQRYLDSEINYFGAGGKQAVFNIGASTTMVSKTEKNDDIVELTLSTKKFEKKAETDIDSVYMDEILTRSKGVDREIDSNPSTSEHILNNVIIEMENSYKSFTICAIKDVFPKHHPQFKKNNENTTYWTKGLARIYHYYLHGPKGNLKGRQQELPPDLKDIGIIIQVFSVKTSNGGQLEIQSKHTINLKEIYDDFETLLVQSAVDTFEFEVEHYEYPGVVIEGIVRYYPYLYDHETLPTLTANEELGETTSEMSTKTSATENQIEEVLNPSQSKSKHREVFECFWHGRLIPQDCIDFEWSKFDPKNSNLKGYEECFNRISGALFTNHAFKVSQNKQSFTELSKLMAQKDCLTFYRVNEESSRRPFRVKFENDFINWIKACHNKYDKQVVYMEYKEDISRNDFPTLKKNSFTEIYSAFNAIYWRDRKWRKGDLIQTKKTKPAGLIGKINRFLVPKCTCDPVSGNFVGSPGFVEIYQLPEKVYGNDSDASKIITFNQINTDADKQLITNELNKILEKLPHTIDVTFPKGNALEPGCELIAGHPIGDMRVILKNMKGERFTSDRFPYKISHKRIKIQLEILKVLDEGGKIETELEVEYPLNDFSREWDYWFIKNENGIEKVGNYRLVSVCTAISNMKVEGDFANGEPLPSSTPINFTVIADAPENFEIIEKQLKTSIGDPFDLTLKFTDLYENQTNPEDSVGEPSLSINDRLKVEDSYKFEIKEDRAYIKNIVIKGHITENQNPILKVSMPAINKTQEIAVTLQKGSPSQIRILSAKSEFTNGEVPELGLLLFDRGGNEVTFDKNYTVICRLYEKDTNKKVINDIVMIENMHNNKRALVIDKEIVVKGNDIPFNSRKFYFEFRIKNTNVFIQKDVTLKKNSKPSYIKLYFTNSLGDNSEAIELPNEEKREFPANSLLSGVHFKAFDCDDTPIDLKEFENQTVNINWSNKLSSGLFLINAEGTLPPIHVHTDSNEERLITFSWKQLKKDINVDYSFLLKPYPECATRMAINTDSHDLKFAVGQIVNQSIQVSVLDAYNNIIKSDDILKRLVVNPMTPKLIIDEKSLKRENPRININNALQNGMPFVFKNIKLLPNPSLTENDSYLGPTRLKFSIPGVNEISETIDINVVNGPPAQINWMAQNKCQNQMNNKRLEIRAQLCDEFKNPIVDNKISITLFLGEDFIQKQLTSETDEEMGIALFSEQININNIKKPSQCCIPQDLVGEFHQRCSSNCFGFYKFQAFTKYKLKTIKSHYHWLHVLCDNMNPTKIEYRIHGKTSVVTKSQEMPTFTVRLFAEDNSLIYDFDSNKVEMQLINTKDPTKFLVFQPVPPSTKETFRFRVDRAPNPNSYKVKFVCYGLKRIEQEFHQNLEVVPDLPIRLAVRSQPLKKFSVVTNVGQKRGILESPLILDLVDRHNNSIYENIPERELNNSPLYSGTLRATIVINHLDTDERIPVPELEGCDANLRLYFPIRRGRVTIREDQLKLRENTQGVSNTRYCVQLNAFFQDDVLNRKYPIESFLINIMFTNDTERQQQLNEIQTELSFLQNQKEDICKELEDKKKELREQERKYRRVRDKEKTLIEKLGDLKEKSDLTDEQKIDNKLKENQQKLNVLTVKQSERKFRGQEIASAPAIEGVIGKVAHLAFIIDEGLAKSISWYLRNYINCIVVKNAQTAQQLFDEHQIESILSLDMLPNRLPEFLAHLPHDGVFRIYYTIGFIRSTLRLNESFSEIKEDLEKVFTSILGDTLFTTEITKAKMYRKTFEQRIGVCPTIVAKDGILHENGIIEMIPKDDNFVWFQSPPDREYIRFQKVCDILTELYSVHKERVEECKKADKLEAEFQHLERERKTQITELDQTIHEKSQSFADISQTSLEFLDEDSNHSVRSYSSVEVNKRRRSYENRSRSKSRERKRSRN